MEKVCRLEKSTPLLIVAVVTNISSELFPALPCYEGTLGKPPPTKTDEFSEKFQTAFDPAPLIFGKSYCRFFKKLYSLKNHTCGIFLKIVAGD